MTTSSYEICENLIAALKADPGIISYCSTKFSKTPGFFLGIDELDPPETEEAPFVVVMPIGFQDVDQARRHDIFIGCVITDETKSISTGLIKFVGHKTIEEFESVVYAATSAYLDPSTTVHLSIVDEGEPRFKPFFPEFHSARNVKIVSER